MTAMDDEATPAVSEATTDVISEPVATPAEPASESTEQELTLEEAFQAARAELAGEETPATTDQKPEGEDGTPEPSADTSEGNDGDGEGEAPPPDETPPARELVDAQAALRRIETLASQNRLQELSPQERGAYSAIQAQIADAAAREQRWHDEFDSLQALKTEDPEEYIRRLDEDPAVVRFESLHKQQFPSYEPGKQQVKPEHIVRSEVNAEWDNMLMGMASEIAKEAGVPADQFKEITESGKGVGTLLASVVDSAVKVGVERALAKELEAALKDERVALRREIETELAGQRLVRFPQGGTPENPNAKKPSTGNDMMDAYREAQEQLAAG